MNMLQNIHRQGYCHNDITRHKLLFDLVGVKVIGLGRAEKAFGTTGKELRRKDFRALEEVLNSAEMERVENVEGARPPKRPRRNSDPVKSVLQMVSVVLLGPIEEGDLDVQFYSGEISRWMTEGSFPSGTIKTWGVFLEIEFPRGEDGAYFRKVWESDDHRLQIPLQQWERRDKAL